MDPTTRAATNRAIRNIQTELEFLLDHNLLTGSQLAAIEQMLPKTNSNHPTATPIPSAVSPPPQLAAPVEQMARTSLNEKKEQSQFYNPTPSPAPPPPAYGQAPMPPQQPAVLAMANSLYDYRPSDAGDLELRPNDRISILEYMNADWAKGRNERTGLEGIFPRSYVRVEEKGMMQAMSPPPPANRVPEGMGYGNVPLQVASEPVQGQPSGQPSKLQEGGKKFGKKLGNAAIFGAGATIGGNIVNSIF